MNHHLPPRSAAWVTLLMHGMTVAIIVFLFLTSGAYLARHFFEIPVPCFEKDAFGVWSVSVCATL